MVREIRQRTRRRFSAEEKIKNVLEGMRGKVTISGVYQKHGVHANNYFRWSQEFFETGKIRLNGDTLHKATFNIIPSVKEMLRFTGIHKGNAPRLHSDKGGCDVSCERDKSIGQGSGSGNSPSGTGE
ncbi:MAG: transposase [Bacteroidales bacterium]